MGRCLEQCLVPAAPFPSGLPLLCGQGRQPCGCWNSLNSLSFPGQVQEESVSQQTFHHPPSFQRSHHFTETLWQLRLFGWKENHQGESSVIHSQGCVLARGPAPEQGRRWSWCSPAPSGGSWAHPGIFLATVSAWGEHVPSLKRWDTSSASRAELLLLWQESHGSS